MHSKEEHQLNTLIPHRSRRLFHKRSHHITIRTSIKGIRLDKEPFLSKAKEYLVAFSRSNGIAVNTWAIKANHIHIICQFSPATDGKGKNSLDIGKVFGNALRTLFSSIAKFCNRRLNRRGTFWQDRYFIRPLKTAREVVHCFKYVICNNIGRNPNPLMDEQVSLFDQLFNNLHLPILGWTATWLGIKEGDWLSYKKALLACIP